VGIPKLVADLTQWLKDWDAVHIQKRLKPAFDKTNPGAPAALLSGPPGIGKTTTAKLVAATCGREVMELNASDARSKNLVGQLLKDAVQSKAFSFDPDAKNKGTGRVVIMDEVDGMSSSDRGGMAELIKIIKLSRTPIICICNDRQKTTVRSLANSCYDLRFSRPQVGSIVKRLKMVAKAEGLEVEDAALEGIVQSSGNDIRQVLNALQMWRTTSKDLSRKEAEARVGEIKKDAVLRLNAFDATSFVFNESHSSNLQQRTEAFFTDYDLIPLMIAQVNFARTMFFPCHHPIANDF